MGVPALAALLAIGCGVAGLVLASGRRARFLVPASGVLLACVTVFGLIPELRERIGWMNSLALVGAGFLLLVVLERAGVSVCPSCQHGDGFAVSLVTAIGVHAFVDGWTLVATGNGSGVGVSRAIAAAMLLHKVPEGLALGAMLRGATTLMRTAILLLVAAEGCTFLGGLFGLLSPPGPWVSYPLALAAGTFLYLGLHALEWRRVPARENSL